jgi:hypothetical protein
VVGSERVAKWFGLEDNNWENGAEGAGINDVGDDLDEVDWGKIGGWEVRRGGGMEAGAEERVEDNGSEACAEGLDDSVG